MMCMKRMPPELILTYADKLLAETGGRPAYELPRPTQFETRVAEMQADGHFALSPPGAAGRVVTSSLPQSR